MKAKVWCVPKAEAARFAREVIHAHVYIHAHGHDGPPEIPLLRGRVAILYNGQLPPLWNADRTASTRHYLPWVAPASASKVQLHVVVEPEFAGDFVGRNRLREPGKDYVVRDLQMDKTYLSKYEKRLGSLDPALMTGLKHGAYIPRKSGGESIIATQIALMRRQSLGVKLAVSDVGDATKIFELLAGDSFHSSRADRLRSLSRELRLFTNVYREPHILLEFIREFLTGALAYMNGDATFVRGPRFRQYQHLCQLSPAFLAMALALLDSLPLDVQPRILAVADHLRRGFGDL